MSADLCLYEVADGVATVTLNRPERNNGMNGNLEVAFLRRIRQAADDPAVRAIVVTGAGRSFCPGADLGGARAEGDEPLPNSQISVMSPLSVPKPMIAAINGAAAGVGVAYALMCDVRFAAAGAKLTTAFARRGLIAEYGIAWLLYRTVGRGHAADLLLSARVITAEEAQAIGLVNRVVPAEELLPAALAYARDVAANVSPASMATIKVQLEEVPLQDRETALARAHDLMYQSVKGPDVAEGIGSYLQKRPPAFPPFGQGTRYDWMD